MKGTDSHFRIATAIKNWLLTHRRRDCDEWGFTSHTDPYYIAETMHQIYDDGERAEVLSKAVPRPLQEEARSLYPIGL